MDDDRAAVPPVWAAVILFCVLFWAGAWRVACWLHGLLNA